MNDIPKRVKRGGKPEHEGWKGFLKIYGPAKREGEVKIIGAQCNNCKAILKGHGSKDLEKHRFCT